jgi:hypothetical protein
MRSARVMGLLGLALLTLLLGACEGYSQTGARTKSHQSMNGGDLSVKANKANGTAEQDIEVNAGYPGATLEADVVLTVEKGSFKIELLGKDDEVTLTLEARDGQTVSGHGQMFVDSFDEASYRVTANEAENVEYTIEYTLP